MPERDSEKVGHYFERTPGARALMAEAMRCPSCHSRRVQFPQMTRKFILPTLMAQVFLLLGVLRPEYYCQDCHYAWQPGQAANH